MSINSICDALYGAFVVTENGGVERKQPPNLDEYTLGEIMHFFKHSSCDVPIIKILGILVRFKYDEKYESAFGGGGMPSYVADSHKNSKIINQAIDYVYVTAKYEGSL
jgi:hypothetical protein